MSNSLHCFPYWHGGPNLCPFNFSYGFGHCVNVALSFNRQHMAIALYKMVHAMRMIVQMYT